MLFCPVTRFWLHFGTAMAMAMFAPELERMAYERHRDWITRRHPPGPQRDAAFAYHAEMIDDFYHPGRSPYRAALTYWGWR